MQYIKTRKIISILCMAVLAFVTVFCLVTGSEIPASVNAVTTAFIGFIGYYFGKSTAIEGLDLNKNEGEYDDEYYS